MSANQAKLNAARFAAELIAERIDSIERLGVGTGSTVRLVIEYLLSDRKIVEKIKKLKLYVSSLDTWFTLRRYGLEPYTHLPGETIDLYFDGADEVVLTEECPLIKGRGAALTREKILAFNSKHTIIVIDKSKVSPRLGYLNKPLPIEVIPVAAEPVLSYLKSIGVRAEIRNACQCRDGPALSDNYGAIIDAWPWELENVEKFVAGLKNVPGVVEHGLFIGLVDEIVVGETDTARIHKCRRTVRR
ncbi:ribose-5-phosphate isomerase RpiA [Pyrofollis japonicus]|uniref:ribose 5-phosphate isomerase A n=1 Tax=Pyrofollis japonicus TaxID=3060460 RepID=UPI00295B9310|nr:ribose 5-phosphate isomerase A [Pyrofollis japonicus]BEP18017.1 ribose-5-phosphate isomerase RpiA [Pyrofollis japonicus]